MNYQDWLNEVPLDEPIILDVLLHFDAKGQVEVLNNLFGDPAAQLDIDELERIYRLNECVTCSTTVDYQQW